MRQTASVLPAVNDFDSLLKVSAKRTEWANLMLEDKLELLDEIHTTMTKKLTYEDYKESGKMGASVMGLDVTTVEGIYEAEMHTWTWTAMVLKLVKDMITSYKILLGKEHPPKKLSKGSLSTRRAINGQIVLDTFPSFQTDKVGFSLTTGEVWMDPKKITDASHVETFNKEKAWTEAAGKEGGLMIVLGAGNHVCLAAVDILQGLFIRNCVVYLKQHPLRDYANSLLGAVFEPVILKGYLGLELHVSNERVAALIYHPAVTAVHLTGGKITHDMLVYGADSKEREVNMKNKTPKLKATMTSELGAVTPWVLVPGIYTREEMDCQAKYIAFAIQSNASCNCGSPKMICVAEEWDQKDEFLKIIEDDLANHVLPAAYYPGIEQRWQSFAAQYPDAKRIDTTTGMGVKERKLGPAKFAEKPLVLPYLQIKISIDLETPSGRDKASKEYAVNNEPFAPMYTIATLKGTSQTDLKSFCKIAATFCNEYLFGTLSGCLTCPPSLLGDEAIQTLVADMKYGLLGINLWSGMGYLGQSSGQWGAYPGEKLEAVQSGIGKMGNMIAVPNIEKFVLTGPIVSPNHGSLKSDLKKEQLVLEALNKFLLKGSFVNLVRLVSVVAGINLMYVTITASGVVAAGLAVLMMRR